jgi:hypothetical protein
MRLMFSIGVAMIVALMVRNALARRAVEGIVYLLDR